LTFSWNDPKDRAKIVRLTADLRNAQVELLSATCAADRLRLHYSAEDIVRFGERQILHKAISSANALCTYFASIAQELESLSSSASELDK
jgi:hypothetical protein